MHELVVGSARELGPVLMQALMSFRYQVFVQRLGWSLPGGGIGWEQDEFDTPDAVYVVQFAGPRTIRACCRLLPASKPYLLSRLLPDLPSGDERWKSETWELSRFAVASHEAGAPIGAMSRASVLMFNASLNIARQQLQARRVVGVLSLAMERLLLRSGVRARRLGPSVACGGKLVVGCVVDLTKAEEPMAHTYQKAEVTTSA